MSEISEEDIRKRIKTILQDADLSTLSAKKVRKKLEEIFETDFTKRKKEVDAWTMELLTKQIEAAEEAKSNGQEEEDKNEDEDVSSDEDKPEPAPPKKKAKKEKTPSKASSTSDDNEDDAEVARRLQEEEESSARRPSRSVAKKPVKRKERKKREKNVNSMYSTPCYLSEDLADIMGTNQMARSEVVKKMWQVVRERNLQDPKNKQWMICDDQLKKVFGGKAKIKAFTMMKYLKNHIKDVKDVS